MIESARLYQSSWAVQTPDNGLSDVRYCIACVTRPSRVESLPSRPIHSNARAKTYIYELHDYQPNYNVCPLATSTATDHEQLLAGAGPSAFFRSTAKRTSEKAFDQLHEPHPQRSGIEGS